MSAGRIAFGLVTVSGLLAACGGDVVYYRPSVAMIVDQADCLAPDIQGRLLALGTDAPAIEPPVGVGYPLGDFAPVSVVRCERGESPSGALTIDSVRLGGEVDAAWGAFRVDSERFPEGTTASCVRQTSSVAVWFVDEDGRAVRPAWPSTGCGTKDGPITTLAALREVDRQQHITQRRADDPGICSTKYGSAFSTTTDADVQEVPEVSPRERIATTFALSFPIEDVGRLQVCRYRESGDESIQESRSRLTAQQSVDVVREIVAAPLAPACSLVATRTATIPLQRPDGSGGAAIDVELDGCTRASSWGLGAVVVPASVLAVLDEPQA